MKFLTRTALFAALVFGLSLSVPQATEAKSVSVTQQVSSLLYRDTGSESYDACSVMALLNPNVTITYAADIFRASDGTRFNDGGTVETGSEIILKFKSHEYTDIFWFGTGYYHDSPYGEWQGADTKPAPECNLKDYVGNSLFMPLAVVTPQKEISVGTGLSCGGLNGGEMRCTVLSAEGSVLNPIFKFSNTTGKFYFRTGNDQECNITEEPLCLAGPNDAAVRSAYSNELNLIIINYPVGHLDRNSVWADWAERRYAAYQILRAERTRYIHQVPATEIPFTLTVTGTPTSTTSTAEPSIGVTATACGEYNVSVTGADPNGERIRYGFDWNNNGTVDEYLPATGYVNSGTLQTRETNWEEGDTQFVKVMVQNETGVSSSWKKQTFNVDDQMYCSSISVDLRANPMTILPGGNSTLTWTTTSVNPVLQCTASEGWSGRKNTNGTQSVSPRATTLYTLSCTDGYSTDDDSATVTVSTDSCLPKPRDQWSCIDTKTYDNGCVPLRCASSFTCSTDPDTAICVPSGKRPHTITADPNRVRSGEPTNIIWKAPAECVVSGGDDEWRGSSGREISSPIVAQTTYTLACPGLEDKTATVRVLPEYQEI